MSRVDRTETLKWTDTLKWAESMLDIDFAIVKKYGVDETWVQCIAWFLDKNLKMSARNYRKDRKQAAKMQRPALEMIYALRGADKALWEYLREHTEAAAEDERDAIRADLADLELEAVIRTLQHKQGANRTNKKWKELAAKVKPKWESWFEGKMPELRSQAAFARWASREICKDRITPRKVEDWSKSWREEVKQARKR